MIYGRGEGLAGCVSRSTGILIGRDGRWEEQQRMREPNVRIVARLLSKEKTLKQMFAGLIYRPRIIYICIFMPPVCSFVINGPNRVCRRSPVQFTVSAPYRVYFFYRTLHGLHVLDIFSSSFFLFCFGFWKHLGLLKSRRDKPDQNGSGVISECNCFKRLSYFSVRQLKLQFSLRCRRVPRGPSVIYGFIFNALCRWL